MKNVISVVVKLSVVGILAISALHVSAQSQTATVHIISVARDGTDLGPIQVESFKSLEGAEVKGRFRDNTAAKVPYGIYDVVIDHSGGSLESRRRVDIVEPIVWIVVSLDIGYGDANTYGASFVVSGTVKNFKPSDEPIFLRLVGVYTDYVGDTKLRPSGENRGTFTLSGMEPPGRYVLITTGRNGVLDTRPLAIEATPTAPIDIDLTKRSGERLTGVR